MVNKAIFFDRDGVLNDLVQHGDLNTAPWSYEEFKFKDRAVEAVDLIRDNYIPIIITNQPDVYDGKLTMVDLIRINNTIKQHLSIKHITSAMVRNTNYYKPNNGMVEMWIEALSIDREKSFLIGDRWKDVVCGYKSGLNTIYIGSKYTTPVEYNCIQPTHIVNDVYEACHKIMEIDNGTAIC